MGKAKILTLEEAMQLEREQMWIQLRNMSVGIPVRYMAEQVPFLLYRNDDLWTEISVRAEMYGVTWRCFDTRPAAESVAVPWEDGGSSWVMETAPEDS